MMRRCALALTVSAALLSLAPHAAGQIANWPAERAPRPLQPRNIPFPPYEVRTLANGMQVVVVLHHEQPAVSLRVLTRAGSAQDPRGLTGVSSLASSLLDQGTTTRSAQQIAEQVDQIGAALGVGSGSDLSFITAVAMKDSFGPVLELVADVARNPAFAPEEIDRQKQLIISNLRVNAQDPDYIANVLFDRLVYGFHPYGLPNSGTADTLSKVTRQDLQAFHRRYFVPNNMILAIVGDLTSQEAFAAVERVFGGWARSEVPVAQSIEPPPPTRRIVVVDKPDAVQTEIRAGLLAIPRKHQDYLAFDLASKILGGEGANRLHNTLRSERGLTYGASADTEARKQAGDLVAETDTRTETTGEVLRLMIDEFSRMPRERVFERELAGAQAYLAGSFPLTIETPNDIATEVLNVIFYDLPVAEIGTFPQRVQAVTPDDILRVSKQYIRPDRLSIVLVGNASAFVPQLRQMGFTQLEVIPIQDLDLMSASLRREPRTAVAAPAPGGPRRVMASIEVAFAPRAAESAQAPAASDSRAPELMTRVVQAMGGIDRLKALRTMVADAETSFQTEQGQLPSTTRTYIAYPDRFRVEAQVDGADVVQVFSAGQAWVEDPGGVHDLPPSQREDFASSVRRDLIPLLVAVAEGRLTARQLPEEGRDGRVLKVLEVRGSELPPVQLYIDAEGLIARRSFIAPGIGGRPARVEEVLSDYRSVNGVMVPFKAELFRDERVVLTRILTQVSFDQMLDAELFRHP